MRTLVVGMQSSGASWVATRVAQKNDVVVVDLFAPCRVPFELGDLPNVTLKCVITNMVSISEQIERFKPDRTVLVTRDPASIRASLARKDYRDLCGTVEQKMAIYLDLLADAKRFSRVLSYERAQWTAAGVDGDTQPRTRAEVLVFNSERSLWCEREYNRSWGFGGWK